MNGGFVNETSGAGEREGKTEPRIFEEWLERGKPAVNNLLWEWLPGSTTIEEADEIACEITQLITNAWERKNDESAS